MTKIKSSFSLCFSSEKSFDSMLDSITNANNSIFIEQYIFLPDEIGHRFAELLIAKSNEGIQVKLMLDWWGSLRLVFSKLGRRIKKSSIELKYFRSPTLKKLFLFNFLPRDHRKILIVDEKTCFVGGVCICDEAKTWQDAMVRIDGSVSLSLSKIFDDTWNDSYKKKHYNAHDSNAELFFLINDGWRQELSDFVIDTINKSSSVLKISTPYFSPNPKLLKALLAALDRGVKIELMLPEKANYISYALGRLLCESLLKKGAQIFLYQSNLLHLKLMISDNNLIAHGSLNFDSLSFLHNLEVMMFTENTEISKKYIEKFSELKSNTKSFTLKDFHNRSIKEKLIAKFLKLFRNFL